MLSKWAISSLSSLNRKRPYFCKAIPGPEMTSPILWAPGIFWVLSALHAHKIPRFGGVGFSWKRGGWGGSANFIFMGVGIFLIVNG